MKTLIATGTVYQDDEGWWFDKESEEIIGPHPEIERPRTEEELKAFRLFREAHPDLAACIDREHKTRDPGKKSPHKAGFLVALAFDDRFRRGLLALFRQFRNRWRVGAFDLPVEIFLRDVGDADCGNLLAFRHACRFGDRLSCLKSVAAVTFRLGVLIVLASRRFNLFEQCTVDLHV